MIFHHSRVMLLIWISSNGLSPLSARTFSMAWMTSKPPVARPKTLQA